MEAVSSLSLKKKTKQEIHNISNSLIIIYNLVHHAAVYIYQLDVLQKLCLLHKSTYADFMLLQKYVDTFSFTKLILTKKYDFLSLHHWLCTWITCELWLHFHTSSIHKYCSDLYRCQYWERHKEMRLTRYKKNCKHL